MKQIIFLLVLFGIVSCDDGAKKKSNVGLPVVEPTSEGPRLRNPLQVPDAASIISVEKIGEALQLNPQSLNQSCGLSSAAQDDSYCFYKWDSDFRNSGILLQVSRNPIYDEYADWAIARIQTLLESGESVVGEGNAKFEAYREVGDAGAWSDQAGKFYWRHGKDYVFMLAFNTDYPADKKYEIATKIAKEIMKQYS